VAWFGAVVVIIRWGLELKDWLDSLTPHAAN